MQDVGQADKNACVGKKYTRSLNNYFFVAGPYFIIVV